MAPPQLDSDDYYKVLGVARDASDADIKKAFRRLAIKYHPDKAKGDKEKATENFKKISEAYEVLSDKEKRNSYNNFGKGGFTGKDFNFTNPNDLFSQVFGQNGDPFANLFTSTFDGGSAFNFDGQHAFHFNDGGMNDPFQAFQSFGSGAGMDPFKSIFENFGPKRGQKSRPSVEYDCLRPGQAVLLKNLQQQTYLNDYQGIVKRFDRMKGRYLVEVDDIGEKSLRKENLIQIVSGVKVMGLVSKQHLNGRAGLVVDVDESKNRCFIRVGGEFVSISCENLIFPTKTVVRIVGLSKGTHFNHRVGTITDIDNMKHRYTVQLSSSEKLAVRFSNVCLY